MDVKITKVIVYNISNDNIINIIINRDDFIDYWSVKITPYLLILFW